MNIADFILAHPGPQHNAKLGTGRPVSVHNYTIIII